MDTLQRTQHGEEEDDEEEAQSCEFQLLPTVREDEENVSLADILSLRDSSLTEEEVCAVCVECCRSLQSLGHSPLFHTLCVMPDTLAFNTHGNVCFMEELRGVPAGIQGWLLQEHMMQKVPLHPQSLTGLETLLQLSLASAQIGHVFSLGCTLSASLDWSMAVSSELRRLLEQMQQENPEDRPQIQDVITASQLSDASSATICRRLSAVGRRVLSLESMGTDGCGSPCRTEENHNGHPNTKDLPRSKCQNSSPDRMGRQERGCQSRAILNRSSSIPDSNNSASIVPRRLNLNTSVSNLSRLGLQEKLQKHNIWASRPHLHDQRWVAEEETTLQPDENVKEWGGDSPYAAPPTATCQNRPVENSRDTHSYACNNALRPSEDTQDNWLCLKELLSLLQRPLSVDELWTLCYTCLNSLQTYTDYPAYLCLDSVYVSRTGQMLFLKARRAGCSNTFYQAPEFQEHGIVTEKACVYSVAAVLWAAAKFGLSLDQKLTLPRKLKRLLLDMAKKAPVERPSINAARKSCQDYLLHQGTTPQEVWDRMILSTEQSQNRTPACLKNGEISQEPEKLGFLPRTAQSKLSPVPGPVPHQPATAPLPSAFTSSATHFTPIILAGSGEAMDEVVRCNQISSETEASPIRGRANTEMEQDKASGIPLPTGSPASSNRNLSHSTTPNSSCSSSISSSSSVNTAAQPGAHSFSSYLLRQDPHTGLLTLLPVQVALSEAIGGLNLSVPSPAIPLQTIPADTVPPSSHGLTNVVIKKHSTWTQPGQHNDLEDTCQPVPPPCQLHPSLQAVIALIRAEFALDRSLEDREEMRMGQYIFSLRKLQLDTFSRAVSEKFSQLQWNDGLLSALHHVVNTQRTHLSTSAKAESLSQASRGERACVADKQELSSKRDMAAPKPHTQASESQQEECRYTGPGETPSHNSLLDMDSRASASPSCHLHSEGGSLTWALAFYGRDTFSRDIITYMEKLGHYGDLPVTKMQELHQQLVIERRNLKKTRTFHQKLLLQECKSKGTEAMLAKLSAELEETSAKVDFLHWVKMYLEVLHMEQWGLDAPLLPVACSQASLELLPAENQSALNIQSGTGHLQGGTPQDLMLYLYSRTAPSEGYIQQFLYTYRYFCSPCQLLLFITGKLSSTAGQEHLTHHAKVHQRSLDLLQVWLEECVSVDFPAESQQAQELERFLSQVIPVDKRVEMLLTLLQNSNRKSRSCFGPISSQEESSRYEHNLENTSREDLQCVLKRSPEHKECALTHLSYRSLTDSLCQKPLPLCHSEYSAQDCAQQLTLLQQELFHLCHPIHFLNSRAQGVRDKAACVPRTPSPQEIPVESSSLFCAESELRERVLLQLLRHDECVSNWASAELVLCHSVKAQAALLTKLLTMAKLCYGWRDFSSAMQILTGLEHVIVRQCPAWRHLPSRVSEILQELRGVQVFLKSDSLCLMDQRRQRPTLPASHILAMHIQQLEIGAFTLASGAYKWPKLRNIARVASQVRAFQQTLYPFGVHTELQSYLRHRLRVLGVCDIPQLANSVQHDIPAERHTRKIHDTLRRMKAGLL